MREKIRLLIIDDSKVVRASLAAIFEATDDFLVVGDAESGAQALAMLPHVRPNLVCLDVFMRSDRAANIVRSIMTIAAVPIVLLSDAPPSSAEVYDALDAGAIELLKKPSPSVEQGVATFLETLRHLSRANVRALPSRPQREPRQRAPRVVTIGSSTGGPTALSAILAALPKRLGVPIVIAHHLSRGFETSLAAWLARESRRPVRLATEEDSLSPDEVVLGRPGFNIRVESPSRLLLDVAEDNSNHPSADILFTSAARVFEPGTVIAVVLSGMGKDGLAGARAVAAKNGVVLVQDRATSIVYGMPGEIVQARLANFVGPPEELARTIAEACAQPETSKRSSEPS